MFHSNRWYAGTVAHKVFMYMCLIGVSIISVACNKEETDAQQPETIATDIELTVVNSDVQTSQTFVFSDPDGMGDQPGSGDLITLNTNGTEAGYVVSLRVLDSSNPDAQRDITSEITDPSENYQFFYYVTPEGTDHLDITYSSNSDMDNEGLTIGNQSIWLTDGMTSGGEAIHVLLLKDVDKNAVGVSAGDTTNAGGTTVVKAVFNLSIQ